MYLLESAGRGAWWRARPMACRPTSGSRSRPRSRSSRKAAPASRAPSPNCAELPHPSPTSDPMSTYKGIRKNPSAPQATPTILAALREHPGRGAERQHAPQHRHRRPAPLPPAGREDDGRHGRHRALARRRQPDLPARPRVLPARRRAVDRRRRRPQQRGGRRHPVVLRGDHRRRRAGDRRRDPRRRRDPASATFRSTPAASRIAVPTRTARARSTCRCRSAAWW